nr:hypothetical protein [Streptococcus danieliae]
MIGLCYTIFKHDDKKK